MSDEHATAFEFLEFWKNMALGLKDELVIRGDRIAELEAKLAEARQALLELGKDTNDARRD